MKESPDKYGADLIGVLPSDDGDKLSVEVKRVQAKRATQATLTKPKPKQKETADNCLRDAVSKFMGGINFSDATADHLTNLHLPVVRAVWDIIAVAMIAQDDDWRLLDDKDLLAVKLKKFFESETVRFVDGGACVAMTHEPSQTTKQNAQRKGIQVIDGLDLKGYWAWLGVVCAELGIWLWPRLASTNVPELPGGLVHRGKAQDGSYRRSRVHQQSRL